MIKVVLTRREIEILLRLREGMSLKEVAFQLDVNYNVLKDNLLILRAKLGARSSFHAVILAIRERLIPLYEDGE
ncbi:MAG: helix-turn-helix domain-containing protein [Deltaproteobacteria bacterium]|nr:helix-turn-helix domain-containing protein [Deltaproteobacteria bacterium]